MITAAGIERGSRPYHWWGLPWTRRNPMTIADLVSQGTITAEEAAWLEWHVRSGGSVAVASHAAGAGKSTLAHALIEAIDHSRTRIYIRGNHDPFDWVADAEAALTTILVNEISPHLPVYCWDECAHTVLGLAAGGFQVITTLHARSLDEVMALLTSPQIGAGVADVVALDVVVFLNATLNGRPVVSSIERLSLDGSGSLSARSPCAP